VSGTASDTAVPVSQGIRLRTIGQGFVTLMTVAVFQFFCQDRNLARKKTTVYIDEDLLRAAKIAAARTGQREYEVFETALREHLSLAGTVERIWAGIDPADAPDEQEAAHIASEELGAVRGPSAGRRAG